MKGDESERPPFRQLKPERRPLSTREQVIGVLVVLAVDGLILLIAHVAGWTLLANDGRLTLLAPTLITWGAWWWMRTHPNT